MTDAEYVSLCRTYGPDAVGAAVVRLMERGLELRGALVNTTARRLRLNMIRAETTSHRYAVAPPRGANGPVYTVNPLTGARTVRAPAPPQARKGKARAPRWVSIPPEEREPEGSVERTVAAYEDRVISRCRLALQTPPEQLRRAIARQELAKVMTREPHD